MSILTILKIVVTVGYPLVEYFMGKTNSGSVIGHFLQRLGLEKAPSETANQTEEIK
jgi:hypothetical protein